MVLLVVLVFHVFTTCYQVGNDFLVVYAVFFFSLIGNILNNYSILLIELSTFCIIFTHISRVLASFMISAIVWCLNNVTHGVCDSLILIVLDINCFSDSLTISVHRYKSRKNEAGDREGERERDRNEYWNCHDSGGCAEKERGEGTG